MIRILHSVSNMDRAGIETMLMNYYRYMDKSKVQFDFLCNKKKPGAYDDEIKSMGGRIYHTPGLNPAKYPVYLKYMRELFQEHPEYKIVEAHNGALGVYVESVKYFREENDGKLPSLKSLKKRKEELTKEIAERKKVYTPLKEESRRLEVASDNVYSIFRKTNEMKSDLAWKREWEARVREKARQEQVRQEQRVRQPKRKKRSYDVSL